MERGEYSASRDRARAAAPLVLAAALAGGCTGDAPDAARGGSTELAPPPFVASSRAVDTDLLTARMTVGNDDVPVIRSGASWTATFTLPEGSEQSFPVEVVWSYAVSERGTPIPIARYADEISLADPRTVRIGGTDYVTGGFDEDRDGRDNFTEIDEATDPLVPDADLAPVAPGPEQDDCRLTRLTGERDVDFRADRDLFRFTDRAFEQTRALEIEAERLVYHATFFLETSGTVTIEQRSGLPIDTNAIIYDRRRGSVDTDDTTIVEFYANPPGSPIDGVPARADRPPGPTGPVLLRAVRRTGSGLRGRRGADRHRASHRVRARRILSRARIAGAAGANVPPRPPPPHHAASFPPSRRGVRRSRDTYQSITDQSSPRRTDRISRVA